ncbi:MAG: pyrophosphatase PpaX [Defluviitaleaceae bacterium]|nr:pyrophosphatase PpaX [Defluviitaleaceae bacterium]
MEKPIIKGILFDFDGTLVDTNGLIQSGMRYTFEKLFGSVTDEEISDCMGSPIVETSKRVYPKNPQLFIDTYLDFCIKNHDEMIKVYPGIIQMLEKLKQMNIKMAIVTSKKRHMFLKGVKKTEMEHFFDVTVTEEDVTKHKPAPEPVELAFKELGFERDEVLMVGDNHHDILAAKAANVKSVAVAWSIKGLDHLKQFEPDFIIHKAEDIFDIIK